MEQETTPANTTTGTKKIHPALAVALLVGYTIFSLYSMARNLWAQCAVGTTTLAREWVYTDGAICLLLGGLFGTVLKEALAASGLPEDFADKIDQILAGQEKALTEITGRRHSTWEETQGPYQEPEETPQQETQEAATESALTSRQVVLSTGHTVNVKLRRENAGQR